MQVPFPAVTVKGYSRHVNSWGFPERALDQLDVSGNLVRDFRPIFQAFFDTVVDHFMRKLDDVGLDKLTEELKAAQASVPTSAMEKALLKNTTQKLAIVLSNDSQFSLKPTLKASLLKHFVQGDFLDVKSHVNDTVFFWTKLMDRLHGSPTGCPSCQKHVTRAESLVLFPYAIVHSLNRLNPDLSGGFGRFLSYFSRLITSNEHGKLFSSPKHRFNPLEVFVLRYFEEIWTKMTGQNNTTLNVFDLPALLNDAPVVNEHSNNIWQKGDCNLHKYSIKWFESIYGPFAYILHLNDQQRKTLKPVCTRQERLASSMLNDCCSLTDGLNNHMEQIFTIMKYAIQPPSLKESEQEFNTTFGNAAMYLRYPAKVNPQPIYNPAIRSCVQANPGDKSRHTICKFKRSITNEGFGYSLNTCDFKWLYQRTPFTRAFSKVMQPKGSFKRDNVGLDLSKLTNKMARVTMPKSSGSSNALEVKLVHPKIYDLNNNKDRLDLGKSSRTYQTIDTPFRIGLHDPYSTPDNVELGHRSPAPAT